MGQRGKKSFLKVAQKKYMKATHPILVGFRHQMIIGIKSDAIGAKIASLS